jgi:antitoxin (DNA-binding transcriptional repressor) of toxin-antitoxin stability system
MRTTLVPAQRPASQGRKSCSRCRIAFAVGSDKCRTFYNEAARMKRLSVREVNQQFSRCIVAVEAGEKIAVTKRGKVVALIVPATTAQVRRPGASELERLMREAKPLGIERWRRDAIYDRDR